MKYPIEVEEKRTIYRITLKQSVLDFLNAFNVERGLVYTVKMLFKAPGIMINSYLAEWRFRIVNSFRLLVISTAVSLLVLYLVGLDDFVAGFSDGFNERATDEGKLSYQAFQTLFFDFYNLFLWISIPCYALVSFLFFRRDGFNYAEHIVAQSFYLSGLNIIYTLLFLLAFFLTSETVFILALVLGTLYFFYFMSLFLKGKTIIFFIKTFLAFVFANILYLVVLSLAVVLVFKVGIVQ